MEFLVRQHDGTEVDIDLATAVEWIRSGQLAADSSVFDPATNRWRRADTLPSLEPAFEEASVEVIQEQPRVAAPTAHEFADLALKLGCGAVAVTVPMILGLLLGGFVLLGSVEHSAESLFVAITAIALMVMTPYVVSILTRRLEEDAYTKNYGAALRKAGSTAEPMRTAITAFSIHRSRYQLITTLLLLAAALIHFFLLRSDPTSSRFVVALVIAAVLLMILRGYLLDWRIANGLFGTNAHEARELIEFVLHKGSPGNISGLGTRPFVVYEESDASVLVRPEPQVQS